MLAPLHIHEFFFESRDGSFDPAWEREPRQISRISPTHFHTINLSISHLRAMMDQSFGIPDGDGDGPAIPDSELLHGQDVTLVTSLGYGPPRRQVARRSRRERPERRGGGGGGGGGLRFGLPRGAPAAAAAARALRRRRGSYAVVVRRVDLRHAGAGLLVRGVEDALGLPAAADATLIPPRAAGPGARAEEEDVLVLQLEGRFPTLRPPPEREKEGKGGG
jgi:hypothetical protein